MQENNDGYMRKLESAKYLGISERELSLWMRRRMVPYRKVARRVVLFKRSELDCALAGSMIEVRKGGAK